MNHSIATKFKSLDTNSQTVFKAVVQVISEKIYRLRSFNINSLSWSCEDYDIRKNVKLNRAEYNGCINDLIEAGLIKTERFMSCSETWISLNHLAQEFREISRLLEIIETA